MGDEETDTQIKRLLLGATSHDGWPGRSCRCVASPTKLLTVPCKGFLISVGNSGYCGSVEGRLTRSRKPESLSPSVGWRLEVAWPVIKRRAGLLHRAWAPRRGSPHTVRSSGTSERVAAGAVWHLHRPVTLLLTVAPSPAR